MRWTRQRRARDAIAGRVFGLVSDQAARKTNGAEADGKAVWSWHPLLVSSRRRFCEPDRVRQNRSFADDGDKTNSSPGRARRKPLKPFACGNAGWFPVNLRWLPCAYYHCTRAVGASGTRHSPRPRMGGSWRKASGAWRRESAETRRHSGAPRSGEPGISRFPDAQLRIWGLVLADHPGM